MPLLAPVMTIDCGFCMNQSLVDVLGLLPVRPAYIKPTGRARSTICRESRSPPGDSQFGVNALAIASMTGFARAEGSDGDLRWTWEVKSVNGRNLDMRVRVPTGFEALEPAVRAA